MMAYLVRKLIKRDKLSELECVSEIENLLADIPTIEFRTTNGTLSTWKIESLDELENAVLAIAVSSSDISKMDFIVIDTDLLFENGLSYAETYAGMDIAVPDLQDSHCDIQGITIDKLKNCASIYRDVLVNETEEERFIVRFSAGEIRKIIKKAISENRIDGSKAIGKIGEEIRKLSA